MNDSIKMALKYLAVYSAAVTVGAFAAITLIVCLAAWLEWLLKHLR